jgi:PTH1 family peptidyl-tRNA hydrolase
VAKLIVGLGNPGRQYAATRHNAGALCVERLAARHGLQLAAGRGRSDVARGAIARVPVILARPRLFMNVSGEAVAALVTFYRVAPPDLMIVCDDLDRPFGALRLRADGSSGGHNGLRSIMGHLHRQDFPRLKIGIGRPPPGVAPDRYVLQPFSMAEAAMLPAVLDAATDALECWLSDGLAAAMNRFNGWTPP